jgi:hypothetical protein
MNRKVIQLWEPHLGLPAGLWRRVLALWSFAPVPFFRAFFDREDKRALTLRDGVSRGSDEKSCG